VLLACSAYLLPCWSLESGFLSLCPVGDLGFGLSLEDPGPERTGQSDKERDKERIEIKSERTNERKKERVKEKRKSSKRLEPSLTRVVG